MRRVFKYLPLIILALVIPFAYWVNKTEPRPETIRDFAMDTYLEITIYHQPGEAVLEEILNDFKLLESIFNRYDENSVIYNVNKNAFEKPVSIPSIFENLLQESIKLSGYTEGYFNPAIGPLVDLWRPIIKGEEDSVLPDIDLIKKAISLSKTENIIINEPDGQVSFTILGVSLDFGAVVKGYAVDRAFGILRNRGVDRAVINAGGTIGVYGSPPGRNYWRIGIQHPRKDGIIGVLNLPSTTVVSTSGDYERYNIIGGKRYHHLLNPFTGYPAEELVSVTIINKNGLFSDAVSTAVFAMGLEKGMEFLTQKSLSAIIITSDLQIHFTGEAERLFQPEL
ncbi:MAG: FAD:protein FMN transferase [candidate division WS2 bacterium]|uniref:FAD:protein FMN transferase n=1 Tax=Psychracetigena formicireducens TaxID=2986056 RepID=A0A9E2F0F6_PSYF1|nr:FAD:protein FMN transferase [Candidatus Psychracetigena formicireducens]MBT9144284.1 FAD:protein FMN transferase [Candidatus Psychracetigena formicireducens]MBT9149928.1 FAD:protein FMN transferase [Candidatus Psychracetigena formicireducens]